MPTQGMLAKSIEWQETNQSDTELDGDSREVKERAWVKLKARWELRKQVWPSRFDR
ncbi:MAG: hypothetical protein GY904_14385 [Planctomycetaceae bacterium]|nr:hypothetical protein [Planctomycetaceae bacterium]